MRSGLSTIHQTLTAEASAVLSQSISAASLRRHPQTTPLHVASSLLSSASSPLRLACLRSHPSHPLHFRALELCFSVALDRLSPSPSPSPSPPLSNALVAALKRAQAHQRRSSPDHPHQPLLSVKVDLLHLIVSILDDPSVSRVMREASFSSPAVKTALTSATHDDQPRQEPSKPHTTFDPPRQEPTKPPSAFETSRPPQIQIHGGPIREDEVKKVLDVLDRSKKRNPVLVGDSDPEALLREVLRRLQDRPGIEIVSPAKEFEENRSDAGRRIKELGDSIESRTADGDVVIDLGDLKWLVEAPGGAQQLVSEAGRTAVAEMGRLVKRFDGGRRKVWVVGTASCATYLRCQVYHPAMEAEWDLQAVPIAPRAAPLSGLFPSTTKSTGILSSSVESLTPSRSFTPLIPATAAAMIPKRQPPDRKDMCLVCASGYKKELSKLSAERSSNSNPLPQWLQAAKADAPDQNQSKEQEIHWNQRTEELLVRWREACSRLHPNANLAAAPPPVRVLCQTPRTQVATELALGPSVQQSPTIRTVDPGGCTLDLLSNQEKVDRPVIGDKGDDEFKRLYKGLMEQVAWQADAAAVVASTVVACRSGGGARRRSGGTRNDTWLLFAGPDKVGKRRMAAALSELVFGDAGGDHVVRVSVAGGEDGESDARYWGKVAMDRIADAVRRNPFAVFMLEDVDRADSMVQGSIRRAAERGRLPDSNGREVSLGSAILILTSTKTLVEEPVIDDERRLEVIVRNMWQLELLVEAKATKRRPEWLKAEEERQTRQKRDTKEGGLSLDLNLAVGVSEDEAGDNSHNSSDVTVELDRADDHGRLAIATRAHTLLPELVSMLDDTITFKPVDFSPLRRKVADVVRGKFELVLGHDRAIEVEDEALDGIVAGVWFGDDATGSGRFEDWVERVVVQSFWQLKNRGLVDNGVSAVKLVAVKDGCKATEAGPGGLPDRISIVNKC